MKTLYLLCVLLHTLVSISFAQKDQNSYKPLQQQWSYEEQKVVLDILEYKHQKSLSNAPKQYHKEWKEIYNQRFEYLKEDINQHFYILDEQLNQYYQQILQNILTANPQIPASDIQLLLARNTVANALSMGEGTVVLNIGLLNRLENESQVAFVICHEIAHFMLHHIDHNIQQRIQLKHDKQIKKKVKRIEDSEYNRMKKALALYKEITYANRSTSRQFELEADSLGLIYLSNTDYQPEEALKCLELLDVIDEEKYAEIADLKHTFDHPEYPFKDHWLEKEELDFEYQSFESEEIDLDSLKTHPDCTVRIKTLKPMLLQSDSNTKSAFLQNPDQFTEYVNVLDFELIESAFAQRKYGKCFYLILQLLPEYPQNIYLKASMGKCLFKIHQAQKNHELGKSVEMISPYQDDNYQKVLNFIHRLRLSEIAKITYFFLQKNQPENLHENEDYLYASILSHYISNKTEKLAELKTLYQENFPSGKYIDDLDQF